MTRLCEIGYVLGVILIGLLLAPLLAGGPLDLLGCDPDEAQRLRLAAEREQLVAAAQAYREEHPESDQPVDIFACVRDNDDEAEE